MIYTAIIRSAILSRNRFVSVHITDFYKLLCYFLCMLGEEKDNSTDRKIY